MDALQKAIDYWNGFGVSVEWFVNSDRTEAIAIGGGGDYGYVWSISVDGSGDISTMEADLKDWRIGIEV